MIPEGDIVKGAKLLELPVGTKVFEPGSPCTMFAILKAGKVRVDLVSQHGKPMTLYHFGVGETCVLSTACLMSGDVLCGEAMVEEAVTAYVLSPEQFRERLQTSEPFRAMVFHAFAERLSAMMERMDALVSLPVDARIASALLELVNEEGVVVATHDLLAKEAGTAREVVSRKLSQWRKDGLLMGSRGRIVVLNKRKLRQIINFVT